MVKLVQLAAREIVDRFDVVLFNSHFVKLVVKHEQLVASEIVDRFEQVVLN